MITSPQHDEIVKRLNALEQGEPNVNHDFNLIRRFQIMKVQINNIMVEKLVQLFISFSLTINAHLLCLTSMNLSFDLTFNID